MTRKSNQWQEWQKVAFENHSRKELEKEATKYAICYPKVEKGEILTSKDLQEAYITGAESREKRIEELKAHNEEIENYFVESAGYGRDKVRNFMDIVNKALQQKGERIADLEKENARLITNEKSLLTERKIIVKENAKAKEIIRAYMLYCKGETQKYKEAEREAEQFLKECE